MPPRYLHEVEPVFAGYPTKHEPLEFLNEVLESERAGERALIPLMTEGDENALHSALRRAVRAEGAEPSYCGTFAILAEHRAGTPPCSMTS